MVDTKLNSFFLSRFYLGCLFLAKQLLLTIMHFNTHKQNSHTHTHTNTHTDMHTDNTWLDSSIKNWVTQYLKC